MEDLIMKYLNVTYKDKNFIKIRPKSENGMWYVQPERNEYGSAFSYLGGTYCYTGHLYGEINK